jgi:hypothetical protein
MKINNKIALKVMICLFLMSPMQFSYSDTSLRAPSVDGIFSAGPYYNTKSKSYFELRRGNGFTWEVANEITKNLKYKNTPGQLAIIDSPQTHSFLVKHFQFLENTWIGLQFFCESSKSIWVNGSSLSSNNFSNWALDIDDISLLCIGKQYVPTFILQGSMNWSFPTETTRPDFYLVEYPTGKK